MAMARSSDRPTGKPHRFIQAVLFHSLDLLKISVIGFLCGLQLSCIHSQPTPLMRVYLYNPISQMELGDLSQLGATIKRAETPFGTEIAVDTAASSAEFVIDDQEVIIDDASPFSIPMPDHSATVRITTRSADLTTKTSELKITISNQGMPPYAPPLDEQGTAQWLDSNLDKVMQAHTFHAKNGLKLPYRLFIPAHFDPQIHYPLVIFLHGRGQRGQANEARIYRDVALFTGLNSIVAPNSQRDFPSIVLVPQCSDHSNTEEWAHWIGNSEQEPFKGLGKDGNYSLASTPSLSSAAALELIESTIKKYQIDQNRIYLTGVSMGGFGTWEWSARRPDLFAAAVPMAGYSSLATVAKIRHIPFWIFHGDQDEYNPVAGSRNMYQALQDANAKVRYTELTGFKHVASFTEAWRNTAILPWLFAQSRSAESSKLIAP